jgi:hypothetical protein
MCTQRGYSYNIYIWILTRHNVHNVCTVFSMLSTPYTYGILLKEHGNKADFPRFLHKSVGHRPLTLHFKPFLFWLRIRWDIRNQKMTPRLGESGSRWLSNSVSWGIDDLPSRRVGYWMFKRKLPALVSRRVVESPTRLVRESATSQLGESRVAMVSRGVAIWIF